jgi:hypothetical protein
MGEKNITEEDIIKVFFKGMDMKRYKSLNVDSQVAQIKNIINIWENNKHKMGKK